MSGATYWGWHDPDRKKPAAQKLAEACERHGEKYATRPDRVLVGAGFGGDPTFQAEAARRGVALEVAPYVPAGAIYLGMSDREPETEPEPAARGQLAFDLVRGAA